MTHISPALLSDRDLLDATVHAIDRERRTTAELLTLLAELDTRKLYLGEGCASLFTYYTQVLHLSEPAAHSRITAARAARRYPVIMYDHSPPAAQRTSTISSSDAARTTRTKRCATSARNCGAARSDRSPDD